MRSFVPAFALILISVLTTTAQHTKRATVTQPAEWFSWSNNVKVHKRVSILAEGQFRYARNFEPMQFQFRTGVDLMVTKHLYIMPLGYVYSWNPLYGKQPAAFVNNEHRIYEQVVYKHILGRINFAHRGRLEQRFIQVHQNNNGEIIDQGYDMRVNRFRYRLVANIPLNHDKMDAKTVYVSLYDEAFISWGKTVTYNEPDQNRIFTGVGYQFTKMLSVQGGAFYQVLVKANGAKQENNVGFQVAVHYNIDLTKSN